MIASILRRRDLRLDGVQRLEPWQLMPGTLDPFAMQFTLERSEPAPRMNETQTAISSSNTFNSY
jgi:hypothetical protein